MKALEKLQGKKTYVVAVLLGLAAVAHMAGWIPETMYNELAGLLGAAGLATLRSGVANL